MDERVKEAVNALEDDIVYAKKANLETALINLEYAELILQRIRELDEKLEIASRYNDQ